MNREDIEIQLWEYIDGICDDAARIHVQQMIERDTQWKNRYDELLAIHKALPADIELEEPSMRFSKNVMEAIASTTIATATKKYINPIVIRLIAGFFISSLLVALVYAITLTDWTSSNESIMPKFSFPEISFNGLMGSAVFNVLIWINVIAGLLLLDSLLRRKKTANG